MFTEYLLNWKYSDISVQAYTQNEKIWGLCNEEKQISRYIFITIIICRCLKLAVVALLRLVMNETDAETIKVGANLELSGGTASFGQSVTPDGLQLAIDEINKEGVLGGKQIEIIKADNKSDAAEATNGSIKLINQDQVVAIVGAATSRYPRTSTNCTRF